jgi:hypothetical protein
MIVYLVRFKEIHIESGQKSVSFQPGMTQNDIARPDGCSPGDGDQSGKSIKRVGIIRQFSKNKLEITNFPELIRLVEQPE